ncbi:lipoprotein insertase outer membrane protein LolB [Pigmentiphaga soli]|uniref:Outer-membrane lipoprotein LolB n=2 Tax=Pigmentiphaga soli TaxID=1007095 RepID=A0ABP8HI11_9BURK
MGCRAALRGIGALAAAAMLLAGCAAPRPIPAEGGGAALSRVGRFALRIDEPGGKQNAVQGGFAWRDDGRKLVLDLVSPLGATLARVEAGPGQALLRESNGKETRADNPDALVAIVLGKPIPVEGLRDWLRGELAKQPPAEVAERDAGGRPLAFEQGGWRVRARDYDTAGPTRLQMARTEPTGEDVDLRLVIDPE